ncbi:MAG: sigma-70 family RNA polymerase sigma factor, partial [Candidatus Omnitrophica bacterium]|nr:sigma-70 family RNA polymerase sigma factor [Candidatus Omnitrophota bacterium]
QSLLTTREQIELLDPAKGASRWLIPGNVPEAMAIKETPVYGLRAGQPGSLAIDLQEVFEDKVLATIRGFYLPAIGTTLNGLDSENPASDALTESHRNAVEFLDSFRSEARMGKQEIEGEPVRYETIVKFSVVESGEEKPTKDKYLIVDTPHASRTFIKRENEILELKPEGEVSIDKLPLADFVDLFGRKLGELTHYFPPSYVRENIEQGAKDVFASISVEAKIQYTDTYIYLTLNGTSPIRIGRKAVKVEIFGSEMISEGLKWLLGNVVLRLPVFYLMVQNEEVSASVLSKLSGAKKGDEYQAIFNTLPSEYPGFPSGSPPLSPDKDPSQIQTRRRNGVPETPRPEIKESQTDDEALRERIEIEESVGKVLRIPEKLGIKSVSLFGNKMVVEVFLREAPREVTLELTVTLGKTPRSTQLTKIESGHVTDIMHSEIPGILHKLAQALNSVPSSSKVAAIGRLEKSKRLFVILEDQTGRLRGSSAIQALLEDGKSMRRLEFKTGRWLKGSIWGKSPDDPNRTSEVYSYYTTLGDFPLWIDDLILRLRLERLIKKWVVKDPFFSSRHKLSVTTRPDRSTEFDGEILQEFTIGASRSEVRRAVDQPDGSADLSLRYGGGSRRSGARAEVRSAVKEVEWETKTFEMAIEPVFHGAPLEAKIFRLRPGSDASKKEFEAAFAGLLALPEDPVSKSSFFLFQPDLSVTEFILMILTDKALRLLPLSSRLPAEPADPGTFERLKREFALFKIEHGDRWTEVIDQNHPEKWRRPWAVDRKAPRLYLKDPAPNTLAKSGKIQLVFRTFRSEAGELRSETRATQSSDSGKEEPWKLDDLIDLNSDKINDFWWQGFGEFVKPIVVEHFARFKSVYRGASISVDDLIQRLLLWALEERQKSEANQESAFVLYNPDKGSFRNWLFVVLKNKLLTILRTIRRGQERLPTAKEGLTENLISPSPEETQKEMEPKEQAIRDAFALLTQEEQDLVRLSVLERKTPTEISEVLGISTNEVNLKIQQALSHLRRITQGMGPGNRKAVRSPEEVIARMQAWERGEYSVENLPREGRLLVNFVLWSKSELSDNWPTPKEFNTFMSKALNPDTLKVKWNIQLKFYLTVYEHLDNPYVKALTSHDDKGITAAFESVMILANHLRKTSGFEGPDPRSEARGDVEHTKGPVRPGLRAEVRSADENARQRLIAFVKNGVYTDPKLPPFPKNSFRTKTVKEEIYFGNLKQGDGWKQIVVSREEIPAGERVQITRRYLDNPPAGVEPQWILKVRYQRKLWSYQFTKTGNFLNQIDLTPSGYLTFFARYGDPANRDTPPFKKKSFQAKAGRGGEIHFGAWREGKSLKRAGLRLQGIPAGQTVRITRRYLDNPPAGVEPQWILKVRYQRKLWSYQFTGSGTHLNQIDLTPSGYLTFFARNGRFDDPELPPFPPDTFERKTLKSGNILFGEWGEGKEKGRKRVVVQIHLRHVPEGHEVTIRKVWDNAGQWLLEVNTHHSSHGTVYYEFHPRKRTLKQVEGVVKEGQPNPKRKFDYAEIKRVWNQLLKDFLLGKIPNPRFFTDLSLLAQRLKVSPDHLEKEILRINARLKKYPGTSLIQHSKIRPRSEARAEVRDSSGLRRGSQQLVDRWNPRGVQTTFGIEDPPGLPRHFLFPGSFLRGGRGVADSQLKGRAAYPPFSGLRKEVSDRTGGNFGRREPSQKENSLGMEGIEKPLDRAVSKDLPTPFIPGDGAFHLLPSPAPEVGLLGVNGGTGLEEKGEPADLFNFGRSQLPQDRNHFTGEFLRLRRHINANNIMTSDPWQMTPPRSEARADGKKSHLLSIEKLQEELKKAFLDFGVPLLNVPRNVEWRNAARTVLAAVEKYHWPIHLSALDHLMILEAHLYEKGDVETILNFFKQLREKYPEKLAALTTVRRILKVYLISRLTVEESMAELVEEPTNVFKKWLEEIGIEFKSQFPDDKSLFSFLKDFSEMLVLVYHARKEQGSPEGEARSPVDNFYLYLSRNFPLNKLGFDLMSHLDDLMKVSEADLLKMMMKVATTRVLKKLFTLESLAEDQKGPPPELEAGELVLIARDFEERLVQTMIEKELMAAVLVKPDGTQEFLVGPLRRIPVDPKEIDLSNLKGKLGGLTVRVIEPPENSPDVRIYFQATHRFEVKANKDETVEMLFERALKEKRIEHALRVEFQDKRVWLRLDPFHPGVYWSEYDTDISLIRPFRGGEIVTIWGFPSRSEARASSDDADHERIVKFLRKKDAGNDFPADERGIEWGEFPLDLSVGENAAAFSKVLTHVGLGDRVKEKRFTPAESPRILIAARSDQKIFLAGMSFFDYPAVSNSEQGVSVFILDQTGGLLDYEGYVRFLRSHLGRQLNFNPLQDVYPLFGRAQFNVREDPMSLTIELTKPEKEPPVKEEGPLLKIRIDTLKGEKHGWRLSGREVELRKVPLELEDSERSTLDRLFRTKFPAGKGQYSLLMSKERGPLMLIKMGEVGVNEIEDNEFLDGMLRNSNEVGKIGDALEQATGSEGLQVEYGLSPLYLNLLEYVPFFRQEDLTGELGAFLIQLAKGELHAFRIDIYGESLIKGIEFKLVKKGDYPVVDMKIFYQESDSTIRSEARSDSLPDGVKDVLKKRAEKLGEGAGNLLSGLIGGLVRVEKLQRDSSGLDLEEALWPIELRWVQQTIELHRKTFLDLKYPFSHQFVVMYFVLDHLSLLRGFAHWYFKNPLLSEDLWNRFLDAARRMAEVFKEAGLGRGEQAAIRKILNEEIPLKAHFESREWTDAARFEEIYRKVESRIRTVLDSYSGGDEKILSLAGDGESRLSDLVERELLIREIAVESLLLIEYRGRNGKKERVPLAGLSRSSQLHEIEEGKLNFVFARGARASLFYRSEVRNGIGDRQGLVKTLEEYERENLLPAWISAHEMQLAWLAAEYAGLLGLNPEEAWALVFAARFHDIGKTLIDPRILNEKGRLDSFQMEKVRKHAGLSAELLRSYGVPQEILAIVRSHHENYEGSGYPDKLQGEKIPRLARALRVLDSFGAMIGLGRPYVREPKTILEAADELKRGKGTLYDPALVDLFLQMLAGLFPDEKTLLLAPHIRRIAIPVGLENFELEPFLHVGPPRNDAFLAKHSFYDYRGKPLGILRGFDFNQWYQGGEFLAVKMGPKYHFYNADGDEVLVLPSTHKLESGTLVDIKSFILLGELILVEFKAEDQEKGIRDLEGALLFKKTGELFLKLVKNKDYERFGTQGGIVWFENGDLITFLNSRGEQILQKRRGIDFDQFGNSSEDGVTREPFIWFQKNGNVTFYNHQGRPILEGLKKDVDFAVRNARGGFLVLGRGESGETDFYNSAGSHMFQKRRGVDFTAWEARDGILELRSPDGLSRFYDRNGEELFVFSGGSDRKDTGQEPSPAKIFFPADPSRLDGWSAYNGIFHLRRFNSEEKVYQHDWYDLSAQLPPRAEVREEVSYGITGGSGAVGSQLIRRLLAQPHTKTIHVLTRRLDDETKMKLAAKHKKVNLIAGDLLDLKALEELVKQSEVIYHLGGWSGLGKMVEEEALRVNNLATALLIELVRKHRKRIIFASTVGVYALGEMKTGQVTEEDMTLNAEAENVLGIQTRSLSKIASELIKQGGDPKALFAERRVALPKEFSSSPFLLYRFTKLLGERQLEDYPDAVVLRFGNVLGPGDESDRTVPKFIREMSRAKPGERKTFIPGRQDSFIDVRDLVRGLEAAARVSVDDGKKIINVASSFPVMQKRLLETIKEITNSLVQVEAMTDEKMKQLGLHPPPPIWFSPKLMTAKLGLNPAHFTTLRKSLGDTKEWLLDLTPEQKWAVPEERSEVRREHQRGQSPFGGQANRFRGEISLRRAAIEVAIVAGGILGLAASPWARERIHRIFNGRLSAPASVPVRRRLSVRRPKVRKPESARNLRVAPVDDDHLGAFFAGATGRFVNSSA